MRECSSGMPTGEALVRSLRSSWALLLLGCPFSRQKGVVRSEASGTHSQALHEGALWWPAQQGSASPLTLQPQQSCGNLQEPEKNGRREKF